MRWLEPTRVLPQPGFERREGDAALRVERQKKPDYLVLIGGQRVAVQREECVGDRERGALVAVDEWMVLRTVGPAETEDDT